MRLFLAYEEHLCARYFEEAQVGFSEFLHFSLLVIHAQEKLLDIEIFCSLTDITDFLYFCVSHSFFKSTIICVLISALTKSHAGLLML